MPAISVIIPLYNKKSFIGAAIDSVLAQTFEDFELIVINDGSTDGGEKHAKAYTDGRVNCFDQKNQGLGAARNAGILRANSPLIALLDADDLWLTKHLEQLMALKTMFPQARLLGTAYDELYPNQKRRSPKYNLRSADDKPLLIKDFFSASLNQPLAHPSSFAFYRGITQEIGLFDPKITYTEDVDFYIRAHLRYCFAFDPRPTAIYRMDSESQITKSGFANKRFADFEGYLNENPNHQSLKRYINSERFYLAMAFRAEGEKTAFDIMKDALNERLLTSRQRLLLHMPRFFLLFAKAIKQLLLGLGIRLTSF